MPIDFGFGMLSRPNRAQMQTWMSDLDFCLPKFAAQYKSLWISDHFFWDDTPTLEAWSVISYMAARWPQFDIGPMVLGQSYRNPALLAKMGATLQILTGGRFIMGIGAGWKEDEYHAYNFPFPPAGVRVEQLADTLEILKRLWTVPSKVTYHGKHYQVTDAYCEPKPDPVPPIMVGGSGIRVLGLAARYADWWNMPDATVPVYADRVQALNAQCEAIGRDPSTLRKTWWGRVVLGHTEAEAQQRGEGKYTRDNTIFGTPQQVIEQMHQFIDLGVDYFMTITVDHTNPDVIGMMLDEVVPAVKKLSR
jgi:alkanesulfonate monooxygenase SsuD/methylene tetrahydromethanopterin reductase-like flavin-dependent oxidoreductase (luciferase family)